MSTRKPIYKQEHRIHETFLCAVIVGIGNETIEHTDNNWFSGVHGGGGYTELVNQSHGWLQLEFGARVLVRAGADLILFDGGTMQKINRRNDPKHRKGKVMHLPEAHSSRCFVLRLIPPFHFSQVRTIQNDPTCIGSH